MSRATHASGDTDWLLQRAADGDSSARAELLDRFRERLKRMVAVRMDPRLARRLDPSDVVQEALMAATQRLPAYLSQRPVAFYPWLRQLAFERLLQLHRHHIDRKKRSIGREVNLQPLPDQSSVVLADQVIDSGAGPVTKVVRAELRSRVTSAIEELPEKYREVLILKHLELLSAPEAAEILEVSEGTVMSRYYRALDILTSALNRTEDPPAPEE